MGPRLAYALELPPDLAGVRVPSLLLQPLVENSIQHGLEQGKQNMLCLDPRCPNGCTYEVIKMWTDDRIGS